MLSVAKPVEENACNGIRAKSKNEIPDLAEKYARHEQSFVRKSRSLLKSLSEKGAIFLWGAGAKGVMYANLIDPDAEFISVLWTLIQTNREDFEWTYGNLSDRLHKTA